MGDRGPTPRFEDVPVAAITTDDALRTLDPAWVEALASMIEEAGLQQPVEVIREGEQYRLTFGHHRVAAVKLLGHGTIRAAVWDSGAFADEADIRLRAVEENIGRRDLSALDRAIHLHEWKRMHEALRGKNRGGRPRKKTSANFATVNLHERFSEAAQKRIGLSERAIQLACKIAEGIRSPELRARITLTKLANNQLELELLADEPAERQTAIVDLVLSGNAGSVTAAIAMLDGHEPPSAAEKRIQRTLSNIRRMDRPARREICRALRDDFMDLAFEEGWLK